MMVTKLEDAGLIVIFGHHNHLDTRIIVVFWECKTLHETLCSNAFIFLFLARFCNVLQERSKIKLVKYKTDTIQYFFCII